MQRRGNSRFPCLRCIGLRVCPLISLWGHSAPEVSVTRLRQASAMQHPSKWQATATQGSSAMVPKILRGCQTPKGAGPEVRDRCSSCPAGSPTDSDTRYISCLGGSLCTSGTPNNCIVRCQLHQHTGSDPTNCSVRCQLHRQHGRRPNCRSVGWHKHHQLGLRPNNRTGTDPETGFCSRQPHGWYLFNTDRTGDVLEIVGQNFDY